MSECVVRKSVWLYFNLTRRAWSSILRRPRLSETSATVSATHARRRKILWDDALKNSCTIPHHVLSLLLVVLPPLHVHRLCVWWATRRPNHLCDQATLCCLSSHKEGSILHTIVLFDISGPLVLPVIWSLWSIVQLRPTFSLSSYNNLVLADTSSSPTSYRHRVKNNLFKK